MANMLTTYLVSNIHKRDLKSIVQDKDNFTILSLHDASPDYITLGDYDFIDFLSKSSLCQDEIIKKSIRGIDIEELNSQLDSQNSIVQQSIDFFENNVSYNDINRYSFYSSLIQNSTNYFAGVDSNFGYALNILNVDRSELKNITNSESEQSSFKNFYKFCIGYNDRNDTIVNSADRLQSVNENDKFKITENIAVLSLAQNLNLYLVNGSNRALTHGTNIFKNISYNYGRDLTEKNLLTFNKRANEDKNTVLGSVLNSYIHLNDFDESVEEFSSEIYNVEKTKNQISDNFFSSEILKTETLANLETLSSDTVINRHSEFILSGDLENNIPENYKLLMNSILKTNRSITNLGVRENFDDVIYRPQSRRSFIQNSNIEVNNILFGKNNEDKNANLSVFIQNIKKKVSIAKNKLVTVAYRSIINDDSLISKLYGRSANRDSVDKADLYSKIGITHSENDSLIHRRSEDRFKSLFVYNDIDVFETNNFLTNKTGFNYFSRANIEELDSVIENHNIEKENIESIIDSYYDKKINNVNIYQELLKKATEGVGFSLGRFNDSQDYEYGNLPVDLIEEVAFISRFTGNTSYTLEKYIPEASVKVYRSNLIKLLYSSSKNSRIFETLLRSYNQHSIESLLRAYDRQNSISLYDAINNDNENRSIYNNALNIRGTDFRDFSNGTGVLIKDFFNDNFTLGAPDHDFRRYAKDLNSEERRSNSYLSPRYFFICGIPFPDVYSFNSRLNYGGLSSPNTSIADRDIYLSQGMSIYYKPLLGLVTNSQTNAAYPSSKETNIFSQLAKRTKGIFKSYVEFLDKHLETFNLSNIKLDDINDNFIKSHVNSFISSTFEAYCNIVIAKLSQTFEYMSILNAVKIHSEAPIDFFLGLDPLDIAEQINDRLRNARGGSIPSSNGFLGGSVGSGDQREDLSKSDIQRKRSVYGGRYDRFLNDSFIKGNVQNPLNNDPSLAERDRLNREDGEIIVLNRSYIIENKRWLMPYSDELSVPRYQFTINFKNKSSNQNRQNGWNGRRNQTTARPSTISNILKTLYHRDDQAKAAFEAYFNQNSFSDDILKQDDENFQLSRANNTTFTGGAFFKEVLTYNSISDNRDNINDQANNNNEYINDLFLEVNQFLYRKNLNILNLFNEVDNLYDSETYISYLSQYNANYPIIQSYNYALNIYNSLVKSSYDLVTNSLQNSLYFKPTNSQYKDAIFNPLYKVYCSLFVSDLAIAYLFDAHRYSFTHFANFKEYLTSLEEEEVPEGDQFNIDSLTDLVSKHYDFPENFDFRDYISKLNASQKSLIKYNINNKTAYLTSVINNFNNIVNNQNSFKDAKLFSSIFSRKRNLKIACIGLREDLVGTDDKTLTVKIRLFDPVSRLVSKPKEFAFKQDLFVLESNGNESTILDYKIVKYDYLSKEFSNVELRLNNETINHVYSFIAKKYLLITSGYGVDENSLKLDLDNTTARKSETPRVTQEVVETVNARIENINDDFSEVVEFGEGLLASDSDFVNIRSNVDFNIKNDVYTDIIDTNTKAKQDIYKRMLLFNYDKLSLDSLGESYMPKEFTKVLYIPFYDHDFDFGDENVNVHNNYVLKIDVEFE